MALSIYLTKKLQYAKLGKREKKRKKERTRERNGERERDRDREREREKEKEIEREKEGERIWRQSSDPASLLRRAGDENRGAEQTADGLCCSEEPSRPREHRTPQTGRGHGESGTKLRKLVMLILICSEPNLI